jgi:hypothetical protein
MVATAPAPANFKTYQDRKQMSEDNSAVEDYKRHCEFHRLLRKYCGPNGYAIITALQDRANSDHDGWCFPSYEKIMEDTGIGNRNAITITLEMLFDLDLIEWQLNGRQGIYRPVKRMNSTELILFRNRAEQYQINTKDSIKTVRSIVSKRYSNVNQSNVNQSNDSLPTPNGVGAAPPFQVVKNLETRDQPTPSSRQVEVSSPAALPNPNQVARPGAGASVAPLKQKLHIPPVPKPVPKIKPPDPVLLDDRLVMWRKYADLAGYGPWPNLLQRQMILDTVPIERLPRWENTLKHWVAHGWQIKNIEDLLDLFVTGKQKRGK